jgi:Na+-driven multidrug efflux pump
LSGLWLQTTLAYVALLMPLAVLVWCHIGELLSWALPDLAATNPNVITLAAEYGRLSCLWLVPDTAVQLMERWLISRQIVDPLVPINVAFLLLTAAANALLVHGVEWSDGTTGYGSAVVVVGLGFRGAPIATFFCATAKVRSRPVEVVRACVDLMPLPCVLCGLWDSNTSCVLLSISCVITPE